MVGVKYTAPNFFLLERIRKAYPDKLILSGFDEMLVQAAISGVDVAGVVIARGEEVKDFSVGQDVYGFMNRYTGAYAEYAVTSIETLAPHPETLDYAQAAAVPRPRGGHPSQSRPRCPLVSLHEGESVP